MSNKKDEKVIPIRGNINTQPISENGEYNTEEIEAMPYDSFEMAKLINNYEEVQMKDSSQDSIIDEINNLKTELKISNSEIANTNKIIRICGTVGSILIAGLGLLITVLIFGINAKYDAIQNINQANMNEIKTEIQAINQRLDYQEKLNSLQIENDINKKIIEQKKN